MLNKHCCHCLDIYANGDNHECIGSLRARIDKLEKALKPFLRITETASASICQIKQSDIRYARECIEN